MNHIWFIHPAQVYNADESGLFLSILPDHTFVTSRKICKKRITFLPCTNASGANKQKLLVIGKSFRPRAFKHFNNNPVVYKANQNAWMSRTLFEEWFQNICVSEVREFLSSKGLVKKAMLLCDNATCHPQDDKLKSDDGQLISENSHISSLHHEISTEFKERCSKHFPQK